MAISVKCALHPSGWLAKPRDVCHISIESLPDGLTHRWVVTFTGGMKPRTIMGILPKTRSGHRHMLHTLRDVCDAAIKAGNLDNKANYSRVKGLSG